MNNWRGVSQAAPHGSILTGMQGTTRSDYVLHGNDTLVGEHLDEYVLRLRDMPPEQKPREKIIFQGVDSLSLAELVAAILGVGTRKEDVLAMAQRIIKEYGEKAIAAEADAQQMSEVLGIPLIKACQLVAAFELGRRFFASQDGKAVYIRTATQAYEYLKTISYSPKEQLRGLYLNSRYEVIHDEIISVGSLTANIVHPREVFRPALENGAVAIIIAHNHPSGSLEPTAEDIAITKQLIMGGKLLGIEVLDHLIIAKDKFARVMERIGEDERL
jgi:DNA repair protein RadC